MVRPRTFLSMLAAAAVLPNVAACIHAPPLQDLWTEPVGGHEVRLTIVYAPEDAPSARQLERVLPLALPVAERWGSLSAPLTVTIHPTHAALETAARRPGHSWLRAWARADRIELQSPRTWSRGEATDSELTQLLAHELTHCVMFQAVGDAARPIPAWFREGMATSNAGESFAAVAALAASRGLKSTPTSDETDSLRVYATADRAFRILLRDYGEDRVRDILVRMRSGAAFDQAVREATGASVEAFEADLETSRRAPPGG